MGLRQFDSVDFKKNGKEETIDLALSKFDKNKDEHTADAKVTGRTLTITASVDGKDYELKIDDVDLETGTKIKRHDKRIEVIVIKTAEFDLEDKYNN